MPQAARCCGVSGETTDARQCPERDDCARFADFAQHGPGDTPAALWLCKTDGFEARGPAHIQVAALFVETDGAYFGLPSVDPWDETRDARKYAGPHPVVAHPPCQRRGRFWHGSTRKPHQFKLGDDGGCFEAALDAVNTWGGVIEHPEGSHAWNTFCIPGPPRRGGWVYAGNGYGSPEAWTCCVYQGHYGHMAGKATWLYVAGVRKHDLPELRWGKVEQRLHPVALARHGYEKARRIGMMAMVGGKDKTRIRNATPPEFRDAVLLPLARLAATGSTCESFRRRTDDALMSVAAGSF